MDAVEARLAGAMSGRRAALQALAGQAEQIVLACRDMAARFEGGGKLVAFGTGGLSADAQHIAVEFVHPVLVGKRALPAISLTADIATLTSITVAEGFEEIFAAQLPLVAGPGDIALGLSTGTDGDAVRRGLQAAGAIGAVTVLITGTDGPRPGPANVDRELRLATNDPRLVKEAMVTCYHLLWELVHVYFEQAGILAGPVHR